MSSASSSTGPPPRRSKTISTATTTAATNEPQQAANNPMKRQQPQAATARTTIQMRRAASKEQRGVSQTNYMGMHSDGDNETIDKPKKTSTAAAAATTNPSGGAPSKSQSRANETSRVESKSAGAARPAPSSSDRQQQQAMSKAKIERGNIKESQETAYLNQQSGANSRESTNDNFIANDSSLSTAGASLSSAGGDSLTRAADNIDDLDNNSNSIETGQANLLLPTAGMTKNLAWAVFASAVGSSFQHGYNNGVMNAPEKLIGEFINDTYKQRNAASGGASENQIDFIFAIIVSIFCIGGCIGALLTAFVADKIGRKEGLMYNNLLVLLACPMMASARAFSSYELLIAGRLVIGINAGLNAGLAPLYLNEIAPVQLRGAFGTIYQLVITISILLSNIFGLPSLFGDQSSWPILFAIPILPAAFMLTVLPNLCESPKFLLLNQGKELQAQQALAWFRQTNDVQDEMEELRNERELNRLTNRSCSLRDMFNDPSLSRPLTIAIVIMLSQQFSGINAVLFYSTSIFRDAGLGEQAAVKATLGMGCVNVIMTLVSLFLVDRAGRRTLHMTGLMGMAATCLVLAICIGSPQQAGAQTTTLNSTISILSIYVFIAMFASGPGAIPWFLVSELFPSNARPVASSIAVAVNWLANFTVSLCFLPLSNILHGYTFIVFAILLVIFYLFTYYKVPETKGATAEEISALFKR